MEVESSAGKLPIRTVGAPGTHGAVVAGTQGTGVRTPAAAAVAVATAGLVGAEHMPKVGMFTSGLLSIIVAAGVPVRVRLTGGTTSVDGAVPKLQIIDAPMQTCIATSSFPPRIEILSARGNCKCGGGIS